MGHIKIEDLQTYISVPVEIAIIDEEGAERAPVVKKIIKQIKLCPDQTHIRIYFDHVRFVAIPITAQLMQTDETWTAYDAECDLRYSIRKV